MKFYEHRAAFSIRPVALAIAICLQLTSCLDLTPGPPTASVRAVVDAGDDFKASACYTCVTSVGTNGVGCGTQKASCEDLQECRDGIACLVEGGWNCYGSSHLLGICSASCGSKVGIKGGDDPAVVPALAYVQCVMGSCAADCFAAGGPDGGATP